jgi:hypothetical protein
MARAVGGTSPCGPTDARSRLEQAKSYISVAELVLGDQSAAMPNVAAALAVLAGIAASDAACCARLKLRSRGQNHSDAVPILESVDPGGKQMAADLKRLLDVKDDAHYGLTFISAGEAKKMVVRAARLVGNAEKAVEA